MEIDELDVELAIWVVLGLIGLIYGAINLDDGLRDRAALLPHPSYRARRVLVETDIRKASLGIGGCILILLLALNATLPLELPTRQFIGRALVIFLEICIVAPVVITVRDKRKASRIVRDDLRGGENVSKSD